MTNVLDLPMVRKTPVLDLDPLRRRIADRMHELGLTYDNVSRQIGMNATYLHHFVFRGRPTVLNENARALLAEKLDISERSLLALENWQVKDRPLTRPARVPAADPLPDRTPIYYDNAKSLTPGATKQWVTLPIIIRDPGIEFGLWISKDRGRLRAGDLVYAQANPLPRKGDTLIVVRNNTVFEIGEMLEISEKSLTLDVGDDAQPIRVFFANNTAIFKVKHIITA